MITENYLSDFMSVEALVGAVWTPLTGDVQSVSIVRGGQRSGPVSTVEPGTLHCTLVNRTDLVDSETLKPNQPIRVRHVIPAVTIDHPAVAVYTQGFEGGTTDSWAAGADVALSNVTDLFYSGARSLRLASIEGDFAAGYASRSVTTELGRSYTLTAWVKAQVGTGSATARLGVTGKAPAVDTGSIGAWKQLTYTFIATSTSHTLELHTTATGLYYDTRWDSITLTRNAWVESVTPAVNTPIFTGRINDIDTRTILDKASGRETEHVNLVAVDAVAALSNTTRYGAVTAGGTGYETWALRIIRLNTSAPASVTVENPADDSPIVRYVL